jgi:transcription elongation GreA/GreB family factor
MSRAFVKEQDDPAAETLPDRPISEHPNFVTPEGLAAIDAELARLNADLAGAGDDRARQTAIQRDLRYWRARRATAEVVEAAANPDEVRFGSTVTIERDGRRQVWRIVGEDEADPAKGSISYVSPLARALAGKSAGDVVEVAGSEVEIIAIA